MFWYLMRSMSAASERFLEDSAFSSAATFLALAASAASRASSLSLSTLASASRSRRELGDLLHQAVQLHLRRLVPVETRCVLGHEHLGLRFLEGLAVGRHRLHRGLQRRGTLAHSQGGSWTSSGIKRTHSGSSMAAAARSASEAIFRLVSRWLVSARVTSRIKLISASKIKN